MRSEQIKMWSLSSDHLNRHSQSISLTETGWDFSIGFFFFFSSDPNLSNRVSTLMTFKIIKWLCDVLMYPIFQCGPFQICSFVNQNHLTV